MNLKCSKYATRNNEHRARGNRKNRRCAVFQRVAILLTSVLFVASGLSSSTLAEAKEKVSSFTNDSLSSVASDAAQTVGLAVSAAANTAGDAITGATSTITNSVSSYFAPTGDDLGTIQGGGGVYLF